MKQPLKRVLSATLAGTMLLSVPLSAQAAEEKSSRKSSREYYLEHYKATGNDIIRQKIEEAALLSEANSAGDVTGDTAERDSGAVYAAGTATQADENGIVYYPVTLIDYDRAAIAQSMANLDVQYAVDKGTFDAANWTWNGLYFNCTQYLYNGSGGYSNNFGTLTGGINPVESYSKPTSVSYNRVIEGTHYYEVGDRHYPVKVTTRTSYFTTYYTITYVNDAGTTEYLANDERNDTVELCTKTITYDYSKNSNQFADWMRWGTNGAWNGETINNEVNRPGYIYGGMVKDQLLPSGVPEFTNSYAHKLFDDTELDGKRVYKNIGLPMEYVDGYYVFDSTYKGAYLPDGVNSADGAKMTLLDGPVTMKKTYWNGTSVMNGGNTYNSAFMPFDNDPAKNTASNNNPYYHYDDTSKKVTSGTYYKIDTDSTVSRNYYFSMIAEIPFTMTENGRVDASDNDSAPVTYEFSGDDDVWVFIDGTLVLDLGGIHDPVSGTIDFAANTVTFQTLNSDATLGVTGDVRSKENPEVGYGMTDHQSSLIQCYLFDTDDVQGKLDIDRETFAATDNHKLTIVYMERGDGLSNNKIRFNLPQKDYIEVKKVIDDDLYKGDEYENNGTLKEDGKISDELFETLNNRNFEFVLYNGSNPSTDFMANRHFSRYDAHNNFIGNGTTTSNGHFFLKNGESVRFYMTADEFDGKTTYTVEEINPDAGSSNNAWTDAAWTHSYSTLAMSTQTLGNNPYFSTLLIPTGSENAVDTITFTCTNKLLSPVIDVVNDEYVIDYGLPVKLNPLANDTYSATGDTLVLVGIGTSADSIAETPAKGVFGTLEKAGNNVIYTLDTQFTGIETFYYKAALSTDLDDTATGTITILPATTMYYEEDFAGLNLQFITGSTNIAPVWTSQIDSSAAITYQEEGRVGDTSDSPYGSDIGYKTYSGDSNGTSKYIDTTNGYATFSYEFTGTGTALYARTSDKSAYLTITIQNKTTGDKLINGFRINTIYKSTGGTKLPADSSITTLYNIPVFSSYEPLPFRPLPFGTYLVTVTVNKAIMAKEQDPATGDWIDSQNSYSRGCDFYLDGIRVYNPIDAFGASSSTATITASEDAYRHDGEANISVLSLREKLLNSAAYITYKTRYNENTEKYEYVLNEEGEPIPVYKWNEDIATGDSFVLFTDSNGEIKDAETYMSAGPKQEVYMNEGQSVSFALGNAGQGWNQNEYKVFIGIKAPAGSGVVSINGTNLTINNTADIYYDITNYSKIANNVAKFEIKSESGLISVTTVKVTGPAKFTITLPVIETEPDDSLYPEGYPFDDEEER